MEKPCTKNIVQSVALADNMRRGAWNVSSGLDYKPGYYATAAEVAEVIQPAAVWRTSFTNHDRLTPESGYSSRAGMAETIAFNPLLP